MVLSASLDRRSVREPLSAYLIIDLVPTEAGTRFTLAPASGVWNTREFVPAVSIGSVVVACLAAMFWPMAIAAAVCYLLILSISWLRDRRSVVAARKSLVDVVWRAWSPALVGAERGGYRALPEADPGSSRR